MNWTPSADQLEQLTGAIDIELLRQCGGHATILELSDGGYRISRAISQSTLKCMTPTAAHIRTAFDVEDKPCYVTGRYVHGAILTPHDPLPELVVYPETYGPDSKKWTMAAKECKAWVADQEAAGRKPIKRDDYFETLGCVRAITSNPDASALLREGDSEVSVFNLECIDGVEFISKIRADHVPPGRCLLDIKTVEVRKSEKASFRKELKHPRFGGKGYGFQAAFYLTRWNAANPDAQKDTFVWVVSEKGEPFVVQLYSATLDQLGEYIDDVNATLRHFASCVRDGVFVGDVSGVQEILV